MTKHCAKCGRFKGATVCQCLVDMVRREAKERQDTLVLMEGARKRLLEEHPRDMGAVCYCG